MAGREFESDLQPDYEVVSRNANGQFNEIAQVIADGDQQRSEFKAKLYAQLYRLASKFGPDHHGVTVLQNSLDEIEKY